jgi:hypothetical protein
MNDLVFSTLKSCPEKLEPHLRNGEHDTNGGIYNEKLALKSRAIISEVLDMVKRKKVLL